MSIFGLDDSIIKENSHVVMYTSPDEIQLIRVMRGAQFHSRLGHFKHDDMIDKEYGTKLFTVNGGERYVHLMRPTPELWTRCLPHRTQIIYTPDCAFITEMLDIKAGSKVVESGTGSGSFTHFLSRAVGPFGHIYTFDFHKARVDQARQEFEKHSLQNVVTIQFSDVCNNGFGLKAIADAVFLDLPSPWLAIANAVAVLRRDKQTRICCFSPCIEQVQRTLTEMIVHNFVDLELFECLALPLETEFLTISTPPSFRGNPEHLNELDAQVTPESTEDASKNNIDSKHMKKEIKELIVSRNEPMMKGHTSYLYFATLPPLSE